MSIVDVESELELYRRSSQRRGSKYIQWLVITITCKFPVIGVVIYSIPVIFKDTCVS